MASRKKAKSERVPAFTITRANGNDAGTFIVMNSSKRVHCGCGHIILSNEKRVALRLTRRCTIHMCKKCARRLTAVLEEIED